MELTSGLRPSDRVVLKSDLIMHDVNKKPTGEVHRAGLIWVALAGLGRKPGVIEFIRSDGKIHLWLDRSGIFEVFDVADSPTFHLARESSMDSIISSYKEILIRLIASRHYIFDKDLRSILPEDGGVYRIFEKDEGWNRSIFIGQSTNLRGRIYDNHYSGNRKSSILKKKMIRQALFEDEAAVKKYLSDECSLQFILISDPIDRSLFEHFAISVLRPAYND